MAVTLVNSTYPPMFSSTFSPAFPTTASPNIYYSLSPFNTAADIRRVHISLVNQTTNENALTDATGILFSEGLQYDSDVGMYYVTIPIDHVKNGSGTGWNYNQYYKLQLRFDTYDGEGIINNSDYFISHLQYFSEWSEIHLLRPILQPQIMLRLWDTQEDEPNASVTFNKGIIPLSGAVYFGEENYTDETETMQSYYIEVLMRDTDTVLMTSDIIYTGNNVDPNVIAYNLDLNGLDTESITNFRLRVHVTTRNSYTLYKDYRFQLAEYVTEDTFDPDIEVTLDNENGIATIHVSNSNTVFGTLYVRRSSSVSAFLDWENIWEDTIAGAIDLEIKDNTIGSGIWYRYAVQLQNNAGALTPTYRSDKIITDFYDCILSRGNKQIDIKFDYTITNFKPVVNRQKMDTLGGRYPKFAENANMNYKQFSISGLISSQEDEDNLFLTPQEYFAGEYSNYLIYNEEHDINEYYDYFWERGFREELVKWLNDGEPKLYRSKTEGLMVVMLTDVMLTPNKTLSRRLYSFSATVYEIGDGNSLDVLDSLGIYDVHSPNDPTQTGGEGGEDQPTPEYVITTKPGQIYQTNVGEMVSGKVDVVANAIMARMKERYGGVLSDKDPSEGYLNNVKIWFHSKPHIFLQMNSGLRLIEDPMQYSQEERNRMQLGYSFEVNNQGIDPDDKTVFFVNRRGYYQIPTSIDVTSLFFPQQDDIVTIEYVVTYKEKNAQGSLIAGTSIEKTLVGQERGVFEAYEYLGEAIRKKYSFVSPGVYYQQMSWWKGICVDVTPYAMVNICYYGDSNYNTYEVGDTGVLHMMRNVSVLDMCFIGRRMHIVDKSRQDYLEGWECVLDDSVDGANKEAKTWHWVTGTDTEAEVFIQQDDEEPITNIENKWSKITVTGNEAPISTSQIKNPKYNTIYQINDELYIYYLNGNWYPVQYIEGSDDTMLAAVPVEGLVSYYGEVIRNTYA